MLFGSVQVAVEVPSTRETMARARTNHHASIRSYLFKNRVREKDTYLS